MFAGDVDERLDAEYSDVGDGDGDEWRCVARRLSGAAELTPEPFVRHLAPDTPVSEQATVCEVTVPISLVFP